APDPRDRASRLAARPPPRRADGVARPGPAAAALGASRRRARRWRRRRLRDPEPRGGRRPRRPRREARGRPPRLRRRARRRRPRVKVLLLLRKDLRILRRSPALAAILVAYPLVIAGLVGLVAGYASSKPRVALVDEDHLPARVVVGGRSFDVNRTI